MTPYPNGKGGSLNDKLPMGCSRDHSKLHRPTGTWIGYYVDFPYFVPTIGSVSFFCSMIGCIFFVHLLTVTLQVHGLSCQRSRDTNPSVHCLRLRSLWGHSLLNGCYMLFLFSQKKQLKIMQGGASQLLLSIAWLIKPLNSGYTIYLPQVEVTYEVTLFTS